MEDCEDAWAESTHASVTSSTNSTDYRVGTKSASLTLTGDITTGNNLATEVVSLDLSAYTHACLWVKSSASVAAGGLKFVMDESANCASPDETLDLPALTAGRWTACPLVFAGATSTRNAIISVGLKTGATIANGTVILIDDVRAMTARQFNTVFKKGINRPEEVRGYGGRSEELLDGSMFHQATVNRKRIVTIGMKVPLTETEQAWLETYISKADMYVIDTNDYFRVVPETFDYQQERAGNISFAQKSTLRLIEKTPWTTQPPSWGYT